MNLKRTSRRAQRRLERLDALMDSYMDWQKESRAVTESYRKWTLAGRSDRGIAFARYATALDLEEKAAARYRGELESMAPLRSLPPERAGVPSMHSL
jgi:hypothetical protein